MFLIAHETRDSLDLISYAGARLSWSISSNFGENSLIKCTSQPKIAKNSRNPAIFGFQDR